jgi:hypothetical protein
MPTLKSLINNLEDSKKEYAENKQTIKDSGKRYTARDTKSRQLKMEMQALEQQIEAKKEDLRIKREARRATKAAKQEASKLLIDKEDE